MSKPKKAPYVWSTLLPNRAGYWFYRPSPAHEETIVTVFKEEGENEWSYRYGSRPSEVNWVLNTRGHEWSGPVPLPAEPVYAIPPQPGV